MSGKLDQSLDEILSTRRKANRGRRPHKPAKTTGTTAKTAPVGGVKKSVKSAKSATKGVPSGPSAPPKESKIIVTGLPHDVNEAQIKEYFAKSVGPVRRVLMTYNQNGRSLGVATIIFSKADAAVKAAKDLNGMLVDKRPMKIEVIVDASNAPAPPTVKSLGERVAANPKAQPRSATSTKATNGAGKKAATKAKKRGKNATRSKPKTAEELDAEMTDYFTNNNGGATTNMTDANGTTNGNAQPATAGGEDLGMDGIS
ncbi:hypothetical protein GJ744_002138 [Endocarpon pusillum]|uniref:RRM domain-containing protein n=1 Tax=Endocarpon pusillum TaxID=364733 RepID=A0A8H7A995_9EURO|nr:hypothetical protein GJ744_002138 [Endocarpon pusillum]